MGRRVKLEVRGVSVVFRTALGEHAALCDVSFDLHEVIACFERPSAGAVRLDGAP